MELKDFKGAERKSFARSIQDDLDERVWRLEEIKKISNFEKFKKEVLDYEDEFMSTDIREDSTKEELIEAIDDEIKRLEAEWLDLDEI